MRIINILIVLIVSFNVNLLNSFQCRPINLYQKYALNKISSSYYNCRINFNMIQNDMNAIEDIEEAGFSRRFGRTIFQEVWTRTTKPIRTRTKWFRNIPGMRRSQRRQPGTLILIRHGESVWNGNQMFTGWVDVDLSERGRREVEHAARLLLERGYKVDLVYTSRLKRAIRSAWIILREMNAIYTPVFKSWKLNERMYGALEGLSKPEMAAKVGEEIVQEWRGGYLARPPIMKKKHPHYHRHERKYSDLSDIPMTESLADTMSRTLPLYNEKIEPLLKEGKTILVCAHGNSLRGLVKHIDNLNETQIKNVGIPNGIPLVYKFERDGDELIALPQSSPKEPVRGEYLEKKGLLRQALESEAEFAASVPGYNVSIRPSSVGYERIFSYDRLPLDPRLRGLAKLDKERKLLNLVAVVNEKNNTNFTKTKTSISNTFLKKEYFINGLDNDVDVNNIKHKKYNPKLRNAWRETGIIYSTKDSPNNENFFLHNLNYDNENINNDLINNKEKDRQWIVIIRHGKTEHNKLGLFTGWEDAQLAPEGRQEARGAGQLLRRHGIKFDVVYTSWLSRAIETAWIVLNGLDSLWLPMIKTWRLNERMYGALTGLSKQMIKEIHGEEQFMKWRRGFSHRPPATSSFSATYPGNDPRYADVKDMPFSLFETCIRTIAHGKIQLHRKLPKTESLKDCILRTLPFYTGTIKPDAIDKGKNVLIASSENAIRGLLMHLCDIPIDKVHNIEIPTGLPLILDIENKRIRLLDDGTGLDPLERYSFGKAPDLLFKPCYEDENNIDMVGARPIKDDNECYLSESGKLYAYDVVVPLPPESQDINYNNSMLSEVEEDIIASNTSF